MINGMIDKKYKRISLLLTIILLTISLVQQGVSTYGNEVIIKYITKFKIFHIFWGICFIVITFFLPKVHSLVNIKKKDSIYFDSFICVAILIGARYFIAFLLFQLGASPYDLSISGIFGNISNILLPLIVTELIRGYVLNTFCRDKNRILFYIISMGIVLCDIKWSTITTLTDIEKVTVYISKNLGPALSQSILLSYLALYGGSLASIIFVIISFVFHWIFPVLPILNWLSDGVIGITIPLFEIPFLTSKYHSINRKLRHKTTNKNEVVSTSITMSLCVFLIWFVVGVFPVYPTVIVTGSMKPLILPGDIVVVEKFTSEEEIRELKKGDIIVFQRDDIIITHRIYDVIMDKDNNPSYITKGDNNSSEDTRTVLATELKGKYMFAIPKLGYPTLWLKSNYIQTRDDVEY